VHTLHEEHKIISYWEGCVCISVCPHGQYPKLYDGIRLELVFAVDKKKCQRI